MEKQKMLMLLLDYTKMQTAALDNDNLEELSKIIQEKQIIIEQINLLRKEITSKEREILEDIAKIDKENQIRFNLNFEEIKKNLKNVRDQKKVHKSYTSYYQEDMSEGVFYDEKSEGV